MPDDMGAMMGLAGEVGDLKGTVRQMKDGLEDLKKALADTDARLTGQLTEQSRLAKENFEDIRGHIQELKDVITGQAAASLVWGQVRGMLWGVIVLAIGAVASIYSGAASWLKFHIFH